MTSPLGLQAFTDGSAVYSGPVTRFENVGGGIEIAYTYMFKNVLVTGLFKGSQQSNGTVDGTWHEDPETPVAGKYVWDGTGTLTLIEIGDRHILFGTWEATSVAPERWMADVRKT